VAIVGNLAAWLRAAGIEPLVHHREL
jgi:hypothetical protein